MAKKVPYKDTPGLRPGYLLASSDLVTCPHPPKARSENLHPRSYPPHQRAGLPVQAGASGVKISRYKVGEYFSEYGIVYRIFEIRKQKNQGNLLMYRRHFASDESSAVIYSIPEESIQKAGIRRLVTKEKLKVLLKELTNKTTNDDEINIHNLRDVLRNNDIDDTIKVLKTLYLAMQKKVLKHPRQQLATLEETKEKVADEIAIVQGVSLSEAKELIDSSLKKLS